MGIRIGNPSFETRVQEGIENDFMLNSVASAQGRFRGRRVRKLGRLAYFRRRNTVAYVGKH
jgi:hypothetical protein